MSMRSRHHEPRPHRDQRKQLIRLACIVLLGLAVLVAAYIVGRRLETASKPGEPKGDLSERFEAAPTIEYEGRQYSARSKLTTILLMGIDKPSGTTAEATVFRNGGQADFLLLLAIDHAEKTVTPIQIDRDIMAEITILGVLGNVAGTRNAQLCLSHGFGDGGKQSSLFTVDAVSKLLLGVPINFYIAMNLDGIGTLNDTLGGVTVTLEDDFTSLDPMMTQGATLKLVGKQAEYYTRNRLNIGIGTNASRMVRQQVYMQEARGLFDAALQKNPNYAGTLFDALEPYLETNMKRGRLINEAWTTRQYPKLSIVQLEGDYTTGEDGFVEFHADQRALTELVLSLFYTQV